MPEGPEIHRAADKLDRALAGRVADEVFFAFEALEPFAEELAGREVLGVEARGKAMLTRFAGGLNVYSHNQLYGRWMLRNRGNVPRTRRSLRFAVHNEKKSAFLYSASSIEVLRDDELAAQSYLAKLGPDPLLDGTTLDDVLARFEDEAFHRRQLSGLLLDQGFIGGVGNYLRTEILWHAAVHPREKLGQVDADRREALARATVTLMRRARELGGVTNDPDVVAQMKAAGRRRREYRHYAFRRQRRPCPRCDTPLVREEHSGRRVYLCPTCQPAPR